MFTDYHTHILPGIDDGANNTETSLSMLKEMKQQGVDRVVATPHFYSHREKSVDNFLQKRKAAYDNIKGQAYVRKIHLGAEVSLEVGISDLEGIEKLAIEGTRLILLEPPIYGYHESMFEDIHNIASEYNLRPIIAHAHRYAMIYTKEQVRKLLEADAIFQINADAFTTFKERRVVKALLKSGCEVVFGTDCHNLNERRPNFQAIIKGTRKFKGTVEKSNGILEKYKLSNN